MATGQIAIKPCAPFNFDLSAHLQQRRQENHQRRSETNRQAMGKWKGLAAYYLVVAEILEVEV